MTLEALPLKRPRPDEEDIEFVPVTKKLNCLSIDNQSSTSESQLKTGDDHDLSGDTNRVNDSHSCARESRGESDESSSRGSSHSAQDPDHYFLDAVMGGLYRPTLDESQNPQYYSINRTLFIAHRDRVRRLSSSPDLNQH